MRWERLELKSVIFAYPAQNGTKPFQLGPLDFTLQPGEIVFVAGGNGSGKSTFAKVLTGLYPPQAGEIRSDGNLVTELTGEWYHGYSRPSSRTSTCSTAY
jgi:putative pyoverdin transport system ATP-binding/permease protein